MHGQDTRRRAWAFPGASPRLPGAQITPLLALVALLLGLFAVLVTPREESRRSTSPWPT
jgi:hypothetical protein